MSSQFDQLASMISGQQDLTPRRINNNYGGIASKNPGLFLCVPENPVKYQISIELGSPFVLDKFIKSPRSDGRFSIRTTFPPGLRSMFYDSTESDTDSEQEEEEGEDDDAQYISIPSSSPFYHPPPPPHPFACPSYDLSFSCDALSDDGSFQVQPATLFHECLDSILPGWRDDELFALNAECLEGLEKDLLLSPMEVFQQNLLSSMKSVSRYSKPPPDVPEGVEVEVDCESCDEDSYYSSEASEEEEEEECVQEKPLWLSRRPRPIDASPLDRRLVAPFEDPTNSSFRSSVVPKTKFCGLFSRN